MAGDKRRRTSETGGHPDGARAIDPTHAASVLAQLLQMYTDGRRTDFAVVVGERRFEVHGCVLMCGSELMRTQLQTGVGAGSMRELREHGDGVSGVDRSLPAGVVSALAGSPPLALGHLSNGADRGAVTLGPTTLKESPTGTSRSMRGRLCAAISRRRCS